MKKLTKNQKLWLAALRSGKYKKGVLKYKRIMPINILMLIKFHRVISEAMSH